MSVKTSFNRADYSNYGYIQNQVARDLVFFFNDDDSIKNILDLGCGDGNVYKLIKDKKFSKFYALDFSRGLLAKHPNEERVIKILKDFDDWNIKFDSIDLSISSSSLQWSKDLSKSLEYMSFLNNKSLVAIFSSNTFKNLHNYLNINSPIYGKEYIINTFKKYFNLKLLKVKEYNLEFKNNYDLFSYIKKSGVSGGNFTLSLTKMRNLIKNYPYKNLEFEVIFLRSF